MFPWHTVNYTPEERAEIKRRMLHMHALFDMPTEVSKTETGYAVTRDGKTGFGSTEDEAHLDLWRLEDEERLKMPLVETNR